jgi:hypothetical protein
MMFLRCPEQMMERRLNAGSVVRHKISMLQDLERGLQEMGRVTIANNALVF